MQNTSQNKPEIDLIDPFTFIDVICKTIHDEYSNVEEWFNDVKRTLAFVIEPFNLIYFKNTDSGLRYYIQEISHAELKDRLSIAEPRFEVPLKVDSEEDYLKTKTKNKLKDKLYHYIIEHQEELTYDRIDLLNENELKENYPNQRILNLFHRFSYTGKRNNKLLETYLKHIREVICNNNSPLYEYVLNILAFYFQHPLERSNVILLLQGDSGVGKDIFMEPIIKLMFPYGRISGQDQFLFCKFNSCMLEFKHLLVFDELFTHTYNTKTEIQKIGKLLSQPEITFHQKYEKGRTYKNILNLIILTGNNFTEHNGSQLIEFYSYENSLKNGNPVVVPVRAALRRDRQYYKTLSESFKQEGFYEALMYYLQNRDISNFQPQNSIPEQKKRSNQKCQI